MIVMMGILLGISFFATTWIVMILAGMAGHLADSQWLMHLGFWKCSPVWIMIILVKSIF